MNRVRFLGFLVGALTFIALGVPASALAGTYTWNLSSDSNATGLGANPGYDQYGQTPWSYLSSNGLIPDPSTFSRLPDFESPSGLSTWSASTSGAPPRVGLNPTTGGVITDGNAAVLPQQVFLEPAPGGSVAVGWTSPFSQAEPVSIDASFADDASGMPPSCAYAATWSVVDQNGNLLVDQNGNPATGNLPATPSFSGSATVAPGGTIYLTISTPLGACGPTGLSLQIAANGTAPGVTLTSPGSGSSSTVNDPTFSGAAGNGFGDGSQVTLHVYSGTSASGTPAQTVTVPRSGAAWSARLGAGLPLGTYTAQAEQDDIASPADVGLSAPVTFTVRAPAVGLDSLGARPLAISTPTFTGTADNDAGSDPFLVVQVFAGTSATGAPVLRLTTAPAASGQYSVSASSALPDGTYTAQAVQGSAAGNTGFSSPQTFSVDAHAPVVALISPAKRSRSDVLQLVFSGTAGSHSFDARVVTVSLYKGRKAVGKPVATLEARVKGSTWSVKWPGTLLRRGLYTALASQTDAVGHVGLSLARTFRVVPLPPVIGGPATINRAGRVSVKVSCNEPVGDTCAGNVLVLTVGNFQTVAGGTLGPLTVMFAYIHIPGGQTATITRAAIPAVATVLRRHAHVAVSISATLHPRRGKTIHVTARIDLRRIGR